MDHNWHIAFHSGMSSKSDLRAAVEELAPVGVVATLLNLSQQILVLPRYLDGGGAVFIDSGAFTAFQKGVEVDWAKVFSVYDTVLGHTERPEGVSIVAPDVIGDQAASLALWAEHAAKVRIWAQAGARVIVPLQRGGLSAGQMLERAVRIFGTDRICAGIPSNLEAMSPEDCSTLRHHDFHILGRVRLTSELRLKLCALLQNNPAAQYTADANWLRSRIRQISGAAAAFREAGRQWPLDSTRTRAVREVLRCEAYSQLKKSTFPSQAFA